MERETGEHHIRPIQKLYIAQRGEIALRAAKTCLKRGLPAVVPYTFSDSNPLATEIAEANLDKGWGLSALGGTSKEENFTNPQALVDEIKLHGCDAVFLGYGFISEDDQAIKLFEENGIRVLAPPSDVMRKTGNKIAAREAAKHVKIGAWSTIPVLEGTGNLETSEQAVTAASVLGYPVILKDPDSGGGNGNRKDLKDEAELLAAYKSIKDTPGNKMVYAERFIKNAVHVEVQIAADAYGNVVSLGVRDCTMQRKDQKVIEESPSPHISDRLSGILQVAAVRFAKAVKYKGLGTFETIIDKDRAGRKDDPAWYFMEFNPRIQVEHPVTEEQIGIDAIDLMIDIAEGKPLPMQQRDVKPKGHTIEARVYAENPDRGFEQDSGVVSVLKFPNIEGVRIDPALREGNELSPWFDPTLAKVIAHADTRELAREKLERALAGTDILGVSSNLTFLTELLNTPEFREGKATTGFVEKWWNQRLTARVQDVAEFLAGGTFTLPEDLPKKHFNPKIFPRTSSVVRRSDGRVVTFQDHIDRLLKTKGKISGLEYGIQERDGVRWVSLIYDYSVNAGGLDPEAGNMVVASAQLAHVLNVDHVTLIRTGGADQWTNALALHQMPRTQAAFRRFPPKSRVSVYHGPAYGGVPASHGDTADYIIMVDSPNSKKGFSGIYLLAKNADIKIDENTKAPEVYKLLEESDPEQFQNAHTAIRALQERTVDYVAISLKDASDKITHYVHATATPDSITDPTRVYEPKEKNELRQGSTEANRVDRPGVFAPVWFSPISRLRERLTRRRARTENAGPLTNYQRWQAVAEVNRPTAADLLDTRLGLFDDSVLLTGPIQHTGKDEYYPPLIAAVTRMEEVRMLVLAHQTQLVTDEITGKLVKKYIAQRPEDYERTMEFLDGIGAKNKLPVFSLVDTLGGDLSTKAEAHGQSKKIGQMQSKRFDYRHASVTFKLGYDFSGGGATLDGTMDGAAAAENSLTFVADPRAKSWIQGGHWFDTESEQFQAFINGEDTARAEVLKDMLLVDTVISEGPGGAHRNRKLFAQNIRAWVLPTLRELIAMPETARLNRRWERSEAPSELFNT